MSFHVAKRNGSTKVGEKPEEQEKVNFEEGDILTEYSKKDLKHCPHLEYHKGDPENFDPEEDSESSGG